MPLPTLTWSRTAITNAASSNAADLLTAFATVLGNATGWEVKSSNTEYVEFGPTGGPIAAFRGLLVGQNGGAPSANSMYSPHTGLNNALHLGIAPDGSGTFAGNWNKTNPTGSQRWSQYMRTCNGGVVDQIYAISSTEVLAIILINDDGGVNFGFICGALLAPARDEDGEGAPGRVFGAAVSGSQFISNNFWSSDTTFLSSGSNSVAPLFGIFRPDDTTDFQLLRRIQTLDPADTGTGYLTTAGGTRVHLPVNYRLLNAPFYYVGELRQMRVAQDAADRVAVQDGQSVTQSFILGADPVVVQDALAFDQG